MLAGAIALIVVSGFIANQVTTNSDQAAVRAAFDKIQRAVEERDVATLELLVHPNFEMQHGLGQSEDRSTWLRLVSANRLARQTSQRREYDPSVIVVGETALIRSLVRLRDTKASHDTWLRGTATFTRLGNRWVQINQQSSLLYDGPASDGATLTEYRGTFEIPGRDGYTLEPRDGYLLLRWPSGSTLPLIPKGADRFEAGVGSTVTFRRDGNGKLIGARRLGPDGRAWWTAKRRTP